MENISKEIISIPENAKIRINWNDRPENYSRDARNRIQKYFSDKYQVPRNNINIVYTPVKLSENGDVIEITGAGIDNIMNVTYQRALFKEWLEREGKKVSYDRLLALDDKVNSSLELTDQDKVHRKYKLKWIYINNFLSFGNDNLFQLDRYKGLTVVNSIPGNFGGKTTLTVDSIKFLFYGKTTKTDKNSEIFNQFTDDEDLVVRGMLEIDDIGEIIIERKMNRKKKRSGDWNITNSLNYYRILPDGSEESLNDVDASQTTQLIKEIIGSEKDFEMVVMATSRNLDNLVDLTTTESGKLLTRFIGLEVIEQKEQEARSMYNTFSKAMKSNIYDSTTLLEEINGHKGEIETLNKLSIEYRDLLVQEKETKNKHETNKTTLIGSKDKIDVEILTLNPKKLEDEINKITETATKHKSDIEEYQKQIDEIGDVKFDEDKDHQLNKDKLSLSNSIAVNSAEVTRLENTIKDLIAGGICQACNRKLDDVDNTEHINKHNLDIEKLNKTIASDEKKLKVVNNGLEELSESKKLIDRKNKLELTRDKLSVEVKSLRNDFKTKNNDLKLYNSNLESINKNKLIDADIDMENTKINVCEHQIEELNKKVEKVRYDVNTNETNIETKTKLIETIKKEGEIETIYKTYIEMTGKKGISKLVLRSVLPIINSELQRLLEGVTEFDVEVSIDDKNDVKISIVKDDIEKSLKSGSGYELTCASIALRCVLGKMSTLPMPNFIAFDEVLGRVADINLELMKPLFDKIKDMFDIVLFITHNEIVKDWSDNIITIVKNDNISKIVAS